MIVKFRPRSAQFGTISIKAAQQCAHCEFGSSIVSKFLKFSAIAAAVGFALYAAGTYYAVPMAARSAIDSLAKQTGCEAQVEKISFNPFSLAFTLEGLKLSGETSVGSSIVLKRAHADASISSLFKLAPIIEKVEIDGLDARFVLNKKNLESIEMLASGSDEGEPASSSSPVSLPKFSLSNFTFTNSSIIIIDEVNKTEQKIESINIALPFISTIESSSRISVEPMLSLKLNGTPIEAKGELKQNGSEQQAKLALKIDKFDAAKVAKSLPIPADLNFNLNSGLLSTDLGIAFTSGHGQSLNISGVVAVDKLSAAVGTDFKASAGRIAVVIKDASPLSQKLSLTSVSIKDAAASALIELNKKTSAASVQNQNSSGSASSAGWTVDVSKFSLENGSLAIREAGVKNPAELSVSKAFASVQGISTRSDADPAVFSASASLLGGRIEAKGTASPAKMLANIDLDASGLSTSSVAGLIEKFTGFNIGAKINLGIKAGVSPDNVQLSGDASVSSLSVKSRGVQLAKAGKAEVFIREFDMKNRRAVVETASVDGFEGRLTRTKNGFAGLESAADSSASNEESRTSSSESAPWNWALGRFTLKNGSLLYKDETKSPAASAGISNISASIINLASNSKTPAKIDFSAKAGDGSLHIAGEALPSPLSGSASVAFVNFDLAPLDPLMREAAGIGAKKGSINTDMTVSLKNKADKQIIGVKGSNLSLRDIHLTDQKGTLLFAWNQADMTNFDFQSSDPFKLYVEDALISVPETKEVQGAKTAANIVGSIAGLLGHKNTENRLDKVNSVLSSKIHIQNIRYDQGRLKAESDSKLADGIIASLSRVISEKLSEQQSKDAKK